MADKQRRPRGLRGPVPGFPGWEFEMPYHDTHAWHVPAYRPSDGKSLVGRGRTLADATADALRRIRELESPERAGAIWTCHAGAGAV